MHYTPKSHYKSNKERNTVISLRRALGAVAYLFPSPHPSKLLNWANTTRLAAQM